MANDRWRLVERLKRKENIRKEKAKILDAVIRDIMDVFEANGISENIEESNKTVTINVKARTYDAMDNLYVTGTVQTEESIDKWANGGIPNAGEPVDDNGKREAFIPLMATHGNPPLSLIKRTWERVKGVLHRGH